MWRRKVRKKKKVECGIKDPDAAERKGPTEEKTSARTNIWKHKWILGNMKGLIEKTAQM